MSTKNISIITVCKGRLHHLQETLPLMISAKPKEIILVDYGCPQKAGSWVANHFPSVRVLCVTDDPGLNLSRARNLGARSSSGDWLFFVDADVRLSTRFCDWANDSLIPNHFYRKANSIRKAEHGAHGSFICPRNAFDTTQGYDEVFRGWGGEDDDFFVRLKLSGIAEDTYPDELVSAIAHDDTQRVAFYGNTSRRTSFIISRFYRSAKMQAMSFHRVSGELPLQMRQQIYATVEKALQPWLNGQTSELPSIRFNLSVKEGLTEEYSLQKDCTLTLHPLKRL